MVVGDNIYLGNSPFLHCPSTAGRENYYCMRHLQYIVRAWRVVTIFSLVHLFYNIATLWRVGKIILLRAAPVLNCDSMAGTRD